jgi:hypothetical protein
MLTLRGVQHILAALTLIYTVLQPRYAALTLNTFTVVLCRVVLHGHYHQNLTKFLHT